MMTTAITNPDPMVVPPIPPLRLHGTSPLLLAGPFASARNATAPAISSRAAFSWVLHQVTRTAGISMLPVKWHSWCVSEPQPPKQRQFGASMGHESLLAESIGHLLLKASLAYFVRYSSPSAHARLTSKLGFCSPGILSQPPFSMKALLS